MGYHRKQINKGIYGEFSKIKEEFEELEDAHDQKDTILELCELSDLVGSIQGYISKYNMSIEDLIKFSDKTKEAFIEGKR